MRLERTPHLRQPAVIGQAYLVPVLPRQALAGRIDHWPVLHEMHTDEAYFGFDRPHFHVDMRFLSDADLHWWRNRFGTVDPGYVITPDFPKATRTVWRRMICRRQPVPFIVTGAAVPEMQAALAGRVAQADRRGILRCPHKGAPLGAVAPVDGVIACPLHGLRICARSRRVMTATEDAKR